ncbi:hypothetical protein AB0B92_40925 [Streptomyces hygroscopicus]|uniref:hypothetical protein n=1 Tax=Streptomyces TaxID=1883 RepID=UPI00209EEDED|nr:hypothetical protein [Streptomyces sp. RKCA744]MCO8301667.1 hypothetical protein [Streptomyces sp. RKCA744]
MGLFSRKTDPEPTNPAMAELGREYANAKRHRDRKTMNRIARQFAEQSNGGSDAASFEQGKRAYEDIPPAYSKPRRGRRR